MDTINNKPRTPSLEETPEISAEKLEPLPYHIEIVQYLKAEESELWNWFTSNKAGEGQTDAIRLELLKTNYRIEPDRQPHLYAAAQEVLIKLGLDVAVTLYQSHTGDRLNAGLVYLPDHAHIILTGPILGMLSSDEIVAMLAHELAHYMLFKGWNGEFRIAAEILQSLSDNSTRHPSHAESARLFALYSEIFADRGAYAVTRDALGTISTLIKLETGVTEVSAENYLRQAEEIFSMGPVQANHLTHPETYIRARAVQLFAKHGTNSTPETQSMIEGPPSLERIDLLLQRRVAENTRRLLQLLLQPAWLDSASVLSHARLFFDDFVPDPGDQEEQLAESIRGSDSSLKEYYSYVLLDFVALARDLEEPPLAAALILSERLGIGKPFVEISIKELGLPKKQVQRIRDDAEKIVAKWNEKAKRP